MHDDLLEIITVLQLASRRDSIFQTSWRWDEQAFSDFAADPDLMRRLRTYVSSTVASFMQMRLSDHDVLRLVQQHIARISLTDQRKALARNFFRASGMPEQDIAGGLNGIDFRYSVEVVHVEAGTRLYRLETPGDTQGSWYAEAPASTADQRGVAPFGEYGVTRRAGGRAYTEWEEEDFRGATPAKVHPEVKRKANVEYVVNHRTTMLKSTAAPIRDTFSTPVRGGSIPTRGGAVQYYARDKTNIR